MTESLMEPMVPTSEANIRQILEQTQAVLPHTKIHLMAFYPANLHLPWQPRLQSVDETAGT
ncbi:MAG: hypothetical protein ACLS36_08715 [Streptococcus sp.]